jgi:hypothetical protein
MEFLVLSVFGLWANPVPEATDAEQKVEGAQALQPSAPQPSPYTEPPPAPEPTPPQASEAGASPATLQL